MRHVARHRLPDLALLRRGNQVRGLISSMPRPTAITVAAALVAVVTLSGVGACGNREDPSKMKPIPTIGQPTPSPSNPADKGVDPSYKPKVIIGGSSFESDAFTFMAPTNWIDAKEDVGSDFIAAAKDGADFSGLPNFVYVFQLPETPKDLKLLESALPSVAKGWGVTNVRVQPRTTLGGRPAARLIGTMKFNKETTVNVDQRFVIVGDDCFAVTFSSLKSLTAPKIAKLKNEIFASWYWRR